MSEPAADHDGELARKTAQLARRAAEFQLLQRVSSEINSTLDLEEIYDAALRVVAELFEFHHAIILLLEPDGETLTVVASRGYETQAIGGRVRIGTGVIGVVAQKRQLLQVNNLGQQRAYAAAQRRQMMKSGRQAELADTVPVPGLPHAECQIAVPLLMRDDLIGVFSLESPVRRSFYYVMELLDGLDLHRIVTRFGPEPAERVIMLLRQACRSLAEAHERGLVHRDIKPANLFVTRLGSEYDYLKVLDFGIVKDQPGQDATMVSGQGILQGTPAFMAPEMIFGNRRTDGRADLYSLASAGYWALTGLTVFEAGTATEMLLHHAQTLPDPPLQKSELPIPKALESILMTCLEKAPGNRLSSALELDSQLARVRCEQPWTDERAQAWWMVHAPDAIAASGVPRAPS